MGSGKVQSHTRDGSEWRRIGGWITLSGVFGPTCVQYKFVLTATNYILQITAKINRLTQGQENEVKICVYVKSPPCDTLYLSMCA